MINLTKQSISTSHNLLHFFVEMMQVRTCTADVNIKYVKLWSSEYGRFT